MSDKAVESKYAIESPSYRCSTCEQEVAPGAPYFSAVLFTDERFVRTEHCPACWGRRADDDCPVYAFWKTSRPRPAEPATPRRRRFDIELLWQFFTRLHGDVSSGETGEEADDPANDVAEDVADETREETPDELAEDDVAGDVTGDEAREDFPDADDETAGADEGESDETVSEDATGESAGREPRPPSPDEKVRLLFLITLLLVRGKRLVLGPSAVRDGAEWLKLTVKNDPDSVYLIENPDLTARDLERVKESLGNLLQMDI